MDQQGYLTVNDGNVAFPSIGVNTSGDAAMTYSLTGRDFFPSSAFTDIGSSGAGLVTLVHVNTQLAFVSARTLFDANALGVMRIKLNSAIFKTRRIV